MAFWAIAAPIISAAAGALIENVFEDDDDSSQAQGQMPNANCGCGGGSSNPLAGIDIAGVVNMVTKLFA